MLPEGQSKAMWQCKWRNLVAKFGTNVVNKRIWFRTNCEMWYWTWIATKMTDIYGWDLWSRRALKWNTNLILKKHCQRHNGPRLLSLRHELSLQLKWSKRYLKDWKRKISWLFLLEVGGRWWKNPHLDETCILYWVWVWKDAIRFHNYKWITESKSCLKRWSTFT